MIRKDRSEEIRDPKTVKESRRKSSPKETEGGRGSGGPEARIDWQERTVLTGA